MDGGVKRGPGRPSKADKVAEALGRPVTFEKLPEGTEWRVEMDNGRGMTLIHDGEPDEIAMEFRRAGI